MTIQRKHQPTLVLMAGLSGAGKTTLALALGHELQWPVIHKDRFKFSLLERRISNEMAGHIAYEQLFDLAYDLVIRQQLSIILDSAALHRFIMNRALEITQVTDVRLKVILCIADQDTREERVKRRPLLIPSTSPIVFDPTMPEDDPRRFAHLPGDKLTVYTARPLETYLKTTIDYTLS